MTAVNVEGNDIKCCQYLVTFTINFMTITHEDIILLLEISTIAFQTSWITIILFICLHAFSNSH